MHMKVFSKVYCDRVYFLCAERFETGSGFDPPPAAPPYPVERWVPPPPGCKLNVSSHHALSPPPPPHYSSRTYCCISRGRMMIGSSSHLQTACNNTTDRRKSRSGCDSSFLQDLGWRIKELLILSSGLQSCNANHTWNSIESITYSGSWFFVFFFNNIILDVYHNYT